MSEQTSIGISKESLKRLKLLAIYSDKKLYELIDEAIVLLEQEYNPLNLIRNNHE